MLRISLERKVVKTILRDYPRIRLEEPKMESLKLKDVILLTTMEWDISSSNRHSEWNRTYVQT
jgi:hypothetical protein